MEFDDLYNKAVFMLLNNWGLFSNVANIKYCLIKGAPLSKYCYGYEGKRQYNDIDFLVSAADMAALESYLLKIGFHQSHNSLVELRKDRIICKSSSHQLKPYIRFVGDKKIVIDINFDIFWGEYEGKRVDIEEFLSDAIEMEIHGVKVKTLTPLKTMVQLILHHFKDMNSIFLLATRNSIRYEMLKDVYFLLKNNLADITIEKLYEISSEYEIIPYVFYILFYTEQVFEDELLKEYIEAFRTPEGERLLNFYGLCEKERKEWQVDFNTRLESENLLPFIESDLTARDKRKIEINKIVFMGVDDEET